MRYCVDCCNWLNEQFPDMGMLPICLNRNKGKWSSTRQYCTVFELAPMSHQNGVGCCRWLNEQFPDMGMLPIRLNRNKGKWSSMKTYTMGAMADSYYEYLLKMWLLKQQKVCNGMCRLSALRSWTCACASSSNRHHTAGLKIHVVNECLHFKPSQVCRCMNNFL